MSSSHPHPARSESRLGLLLASASLVLAAAWLLSRVVVGLDFTDEMQYYGEIAALTRTGKFFQDDFFIQQLPYVFLLPFFKLHATLFPDQSYLILTGRLLLLGGYALTGWLFWRAAAGSGATFARLAGLATFLAWIPFQLFAPSYNTMSYLLNVALVAVWLQRESARPALHVATMAALLTALTVTYPPAGLALAALAVVDTARRRGIRSALILAGTTVLGGALVGAVMVAVHGLDFFAQLQAAVAFSRSLSVGFVLGDSQHFGSWAALMIASGVFVWRMRRGASFARPFGRHTPSALRRTALVAVLVTSAMLLRMSSLWSHGYLSSAALGLLWLWLASSLEPADASAGRDPVRVAALATLVTGGAALVILSTRWGTGFCAGVVYVMLLTVLAASAAPDERLRLADLAIVGMVLGSVYSFSSGNGVHNFGVGAAAVMPFLVLHGARRALTTDGRRWSHMGSFVLPTALVAALLVNGARYPYREAAGFEGFTRERLVPAFRGLWISPVKRDAILLFSQISAPGALAGRRVLVIGPHPWLYFAMGGEPVTPMMFMHFSAGDAANAFLAQQLFRKGRPDVIIVPSAMPAPVHERLLEWRSEGSTAMRFTLPTEFVAHYSRLTRYELQSDIMIFRRPTRTP